MQNSDVFLNLWHKFGDWLNQYNWLEMLLGFGALILLAWFANWLTKHVLVRGIRRFTQLLPVNRNGALSRYQMIERFANIVPALIIKNGISQVPHLSPALIKLIEMLAQASVFLIIVLTLSAGLNVINNLYQRRPDARSRPI
ncbi:hypothetical protein RJJ65_35090, partial [Rhizobium hidalgonense]|nr:hypothetical protein [Rhizobium hidalgonense]